MTLSKNIQIWCDQGGNDRKLSFFFLFTWLDTRPTPSPSLPVHVGDYIHRECGGVTTKYIGSTLPNHVLDIVKFQKNKFVSGYYAAQLEEKGAVTKVIQDKTNKKNIS